MAINIQNIITALEAKVAAATSSTETQELIVIIKSIKAAGQQTIVTYANVASLPAASADNEGNLAYVADVGKVYYSNATTWTEVGSGAALNAGTGITLVTETNGSVTISSSGSGGGTAYDQDLNTTNDVVFNSALIGDVSIIGNTISGVDSYGNDSELLVNAPLTVIAGGVSTNTVLYTDTLTGAGFLQWIGSSNIIQFGYAFENVRELLRALNPGDTFTMYTSAYISEYLTFTLVSKNEENSEFNLTVEEFNTDGTLQFSQNYLELNYNVNTLVNALEVTETGLNVNGVLTVNGQPVGSGGGGSSYDQDLNTTDDVVFNSALIGDVSIVGNQISGIDSYGNPDTLVVSGDLEVTRAATTTDSYDTNNGLSWGLVGGYGTQSIRIESYSNMNTFTQNLLSSLVAGNRITLRSSSNFQLFTYTVVSVTTTPSMGGDAYIIAVEENFIDEPYQVFITVEASSSATPLSVTEAGVNINGALTVNGQPVGGSSFDQDLNTTNDVVFNSALIGDVSVVGNIISAVDSYGNPDTLVVDGNLNVAGSLSVNGQAVGATPTPFGVGSYAMLQLASGNGDIEAGQTVVSAEGFAVGPLFPAGITNPAGGASGTTQAGGVAGIWMCMGYAPSSAGPQITLWYRVS